MITIEISKHTKASKALIQTARVLATQDNSIVITEEKDEQLLRKMIVAKRGQTTTKESVLQTLKQIIEK